MSEPKIYPPWKPKAEPHHPPDYDERVIYSVRALAAGTASAPQQAIVWRWLSYVTGDGMSYRPGGPEGMRATDFAEGKRFVGEQLRKMLHPELTPPDGAAPAPETKKRPKRNR